MPAIGEIIMKRKNLTFVFLAIWCVLVLIYFTIWKLLVYSDFNKRAAADKAHPGRQTRLNGLLKGVAPVKG
jgi:hypothetical protein